MSGRVFRRGSTWTYVVDVGADTQARRKQEMKGGFATRKEAERALRKVLGDLDNQRYVERAKVTVGEYLRDEWLPAAKTNLREASWASYRNHLELHAIPRIGDIPLQQLNAMHLNKLYTWLLARGRVNGTGGLSPRSVRYLHTILRKALQDAARWRLVERNVADLADPPRPDRQLGMRTWSADELRRFLEHVRDDRLYAAWLLAASTGMRRGEVLGLRWIDVDLAAGRLSVRQTLIMVGAEARFSQPKTRRSRRVIELDRHTTGALVEWRKRQAAERKAWGDAWTDTGLVFTREDGSAILPDGWSGTFERHVRDAGLPPIRLHDLRHTHASLMLAAGVNPKVAAERLGHHSAAFTLDVYSHVLPGMQQQAAEHLAGLVMNTESDESEPEEDPDDTDQNPRSEIS